MEVKVSYPENESELSELILSRRPSMYVGSQTSTVIPFDLLGEYYQQDLNMISLVKMRSSIELNESNQAIIKGSVSWEYARSFLRSKGRDIMVAPTDESALVLSGLATSATGEHSFQFATLRDQVQSIEYLDYNGMLKNLRSDYEISFIDLDLLNAYNKDWLKYMGFKNAPFPRFSKETDLMVGTEGQLGIMTGCVLDTTEFIDRNYMVVKLPRWEKDYAPHLEISAKIQHYRDIVYSCELIDSNSLQLVGTEYLDSDFDYIFLEIRDRDLEAFYEQFLSQLHFSSEDQIFQMSAHQFHALRVSIPRAVNEHNSRQGLKKMGTDSQVKTKDIGHLLDAYRHFADLGVQFFLFGHFGDSHLHFNFLPRKDQVGLVQDQLVDFYRKVKSFGGSPFAEHGIGLIKKSFIRQFYGRNQVALFRKLKQVMDPHNQFFPQGFMDYRLEEVLGQNEP
jgi:glycolate oxidase